jgi:hypothetical protein
MGSDQKALKAKLLCHYGKKGDWINLCVYGKIP